MAAGGFKEFVAGETLDEDEINDFLMQGMLVFAGTAARGSAITAPVEGQFSFLADSDSVEFFDGSQWVELESGLLDASGGDHEGESNGYYYHIFLSSGTLTVNKPGACELLLIGGGGSGGAGSLSGAGGGAGGVIFQAMSLTAGSKSVVIGDGGPAVAVSTLGVTGSDSTFNGLTAKGGGGGALNGSAGLLGASGGGGASGTSGVGDGGLAIDSFAYKGYGSQGSQGNDGGASPNTDSTGAGGGGAGSPGHSTRPSADWQTQTTSTFYGTRRQGGIGLRFDDFGANASVVASTTIGDKHDFTLDAGGTSSAYFFAGGGSGTSGATALSGGPGGGGDAVGGNGTDGLGAGGGGKASSGSSGAGGSGILIVRYAV